LKREVLKKSEILRSSLEFERVLKGGKWIASPLFIIYYREAQERKVGFAVSKRIKKKVLRNRIKRRLKELYRRNKDLFPEKIHMVFMGIPETAEAPFLQLQHTLREMIEKLKGGAELQ
jgi:ribonuclease P protein component